MDDLDYRMDLGCFYKILTVGDCYVQDSNGTQLETGKKIRTLKEIKNPKLTCKTYKRLKTEQEDRIRNKGFTQMKLNRNR